VVSEAPQDGAHIMDLPGSARRANCSYAACLGMWSGQPDLSWRWGDGADPRCGSASRLEC
jgi:hypothetical protein